MKKDRITTITKAAEAIKTALLVYFAVEVKGKMPACDAAVQNQVKKAFELNDFFGKAAEQILFYPPDQSDISAARVLILGTGPVNKEKDEGAALDMLREAGGQIAKVCALVKAKDVVICLPAPKHLSPAMDDPEMSAGALAEGIILGDYRFEKYKESTKKKTDYPGLDAIKFVCKDNLNIVRRGVERAKNSAFAACRARDMANEPGNHWTSADFAAYAKQLAADMGLGYRCIEKKEMEQMGMGGILAVNQGSHVPARMVILEYLPEDRTETILLVGKGLTFDSGGISIKPSAGMEDMKYDMCGGAAVMCAMQAVALEKPDVGVVAIVPATDNMSGSKAVHPGDIIRHYNGVTSEVINTDAEGRLILADALAWGIENVKPTCVLDTATLTGAVIIGLGHHYTGLVSNNDALVKAVESAGNLAGEPVWRLPLNKNYEKQIESNVADIKNTGGKPAGTITAAAYLSNFVGKTPWAHLDIAGTAWDFTQKTYIPKGPSGTATRTFINLVRNWKTGNVK
ncbi:leucyl aminopeptidase [Desulfobacter hydrogenophilus]|uniref:Probable cytosol aminopeptidase n=1 Tax=Desulfobacter hydrogenophilus TaxID=2291 RepID=A0A328F8R5_9BACT|nr:leucyl aminopeptidase [Desulfobacter hydrogenophilus]NDY73421.1 leucyl aminopeptidase [Desulfobacter hydrogenophilus]QBH12412.1 leucyl aminopeptidase [Desulfobacter hydrogenophilus]RAM00749.1 leucyl aminopeptidase [Desulfobacter hydrogenophilus]